MKFIRFEEYRINPDAIAHYTYDGDELVICFAKDSNLYFKGDEAAALVKLLDAAIGVAGEEA